MDLWVGPTMAVIYVFLNGSWASFWRKMAAIVFRDKSLRSPSSFGHGDWEVDIWMMSNFSWSYGWCPTFLDPQSALGLHLVMKTEKERSVLLLFDFFGGLFPFCPSPLFLHPTVCPLGRGLCSLFLAWCLGESVSLENGSLRGSTYHKKYIDSLNWSTHHKKYCYIL